jgi:hypothetical protein
LRGAVGGDYQLEGYNINTITTGISSQIPQSSPDNLSREVWAGFGQINIPVVGGAFSLPLAHTSRLTNHFRIFRRCSVGPLRAQGFRAGTGFDVVLMETGVHEPTIMAIRSAV